MSDEERINDNPIISIGFDAIDMGVIKELKKLLIQAEKELKANPLDLSIDQKSMVKEANKLIKNFKSIINTGLKGLKAGTNIDINIGDINSLQKSIEKISNEFVNFIGLGGSINNMLDSIKTDAISNVENDVKKLENTTVDTINQISKAVEKIEKENVKIDIDTSEIDSKIEKTINKMEELDKLTKEISEKSKIKDDNNEIKNNESVESLQKELKLLEEKRELSWKNVKEQQKVVDYINAKNIKLQERQGHIKQTYKQASDFGSEIENYEGALESLNKYRMLSEEARIYDENDIRHKERLLEAQRQLNKAVIQYHTYANSTNNEGNIPKRLIINDKDFSNAILSQFKNVHEKNLNYNKRLEEGRQNYSIEYDKLMQLKEAHSLINQEIDDINKKISAEVKANEIEQALIKDKEQINQQKEVLSTDNVESSISNLKDENKELEKQLSLEEQIAQIAKKDIAQSKDNDKNVNVSNKNINQDFDKVDIQKISTYFDENSINKINNLISEITLSVNKLSEAIDKTGVAIEQAGINLNKINLDEFINNINNFKVDNTFFSQIEDNIRSVVKNSEKELNRLINKIVDTKQELQDVSKKSEKVKKVKEEKETISAIKQQNKIDKLRSAMDKSGLKGNITIDNKGVLILTESIKKVGNEAVTTKYKIEDLNKAINKDGTLSKNYLKNNAVSMSSKDITKQINKDWDSAIKENEKFDRIAQEKIVSKELEKQNDEYNLQVSNIERLKEQGKKQEENIIKENKDKISMYTQMFDEIEQFNKDWDSAIEENEKFDKLMQERAISKELEKQNDEYNLQVDKIEKLKDEGRKQQENIIEENRNRISMYSKMFDEIEQKDKLNKIEKNNKITNVYNALDEAINNYINCSKKAYQSTGELKEEFIRQKKEAEDLINVLSSNIKDGGLHSDKREDKIQKKVSNFKNWENIYNIESKTKTNNDAINLLKRQLTVYDKINNAKLSIDSSSKRNITKEKELNSLLLEKENNYKKINSLIEQGIITKEQYNKVLSYRDGLKQSYSDSLKSQLNTDSLSTNLTKAKTALSSNLLKGVNLKDVKNEINSIMKAFENGEYNTQIKINKANAELKEQISILNELKNKTKVEKQEQTNKKQQQITEAYNELDRAVEKYITLSKKAVQSSGEIKEEFIKQKKEAEELVKILSTDITNKGLYSDKREDKVIKKMLDYEDWENIYNTEKGIKSSKDGDILIENQLKVYDKINSTKLAIDSSSKKNLSKEKELNDLLLQKKSNYEKIDLLIKQGLLDEERYNQVLQHRDDLKNNYYNNLLSQINTSSLTSNLDRAKNNLAFNTLKVEDLINANGLEEAKNKITSIMKSFENGEYNTQIKINKANTELKEQIAILNELKKSSNLVENSKGIFSKTNSIDKNNLKSQMEGIAKVNAQMQNGKIIAQSYSEANKQLSYTVKTADKQFKTFKITVDEVNKGFRTSETSAKKAESIFDQVLGGMSSKFAELFRYIGAIGIIYQTWDAFKRGIEVVKEMNSAVTELRKTCDETDEVINKFVKNSYNIGEKVGSTGVDIVNSTADWTRLGKSLPEAQLLAQDTALLKNVSEFESIEEATEAMVSTTEAFKLSSENAIQAVDKLNNVGNNFSSSTKGLAEGLQTAGSALVSAGNDIDKSIALLTAGNAVNQDMASTASGIRTISLRLRSTSSNADELKAMGEETDGLLETTVKLKEQIEQLTKTSKNAGVNILNNNGNIKDTYDILLSIAKVWKNIQEEDKKDGKNRASALGEIISGKNRYNILSSILQNPEMLENAYKTSQNSEGSATKELARWEESIEASQQKMSNAWQKLWNDTLSSDTIKMFYDISTAILKVVDSFSLLGTVVVSGVGVYLGLHAKEIGHLINNYKELGSITEAIKATFNFGQATNNISKLAKETKNLSINETALQLATKGVEDAEIRATLATQGYAEKDIESAIAKAKKTMAESKNTATTEANTASNVKNTASTEGQTVANAKYTASSEVSSASNIKETTTTESLTEAEIAEAGASLGQATANKGGILGGIMGLASSHPVITAIAGIGALIFATVKIYQAFNVTLDEHKKKLEDLQSQYKDNEANINSLNTELEETKKKIDEINSQKVLTIADENQLNLLKQQTNELKTQLAYEEERQKVLGRKTEREAVDTLNTKMDSKYAREEIIYSDSYAVSPKRVTEIEELQIAIDKYNELEDKVESYKDKQEKLNPNDNNYMKNYDKIQKQIDKYSREMDKVRLYANDLAKSIQNSGDSLIGSTSQGNKLKESIQDALSTYTLFISYIDKNPIEVSEENLLSEDKIKEVFNVEGYSKELKGAYSKIIDYLSEGGDISKLEDKFGSDIIKALYNACNKAGVDFTTLLNNLYVQASSKVNASTLTDILNKLAPKRNIEVDPFSKEDKKKENWIKSLSPDDLKVISNNPLDFNSSMTLNNMKKALEKAKKGLSKDDLTLNLLTDTATSEGIDTYQDKLSKVKETLQKLNSESLTQNEVVDIIQQLGLNPDKIDLSTQAFVGLEEELKRIANQEYGTILLTFEKLYKDGKISKNTFDNLNSTFIDLLNNAKSAGNQVLSVTEAMNKIKTVQNILKSTKEDLEEHKKITNDTLFSIIDAYPQMADTINKYKLGLISIEDVYKELDKCYEVDVENYKQAMLAKMQTDNQFYNHILKNHADMVNEFKNNYNIDLSNYKNLAEAKAKIESQLITACAKAWAKYYTVSTESGEAIVSGTYTSTSMNGGAEMAKQYNEHTKEITEARRKAQESADAYNKIIGELNKIALEGVNIDLKDVDFTSGDSKEKKKKKKKGNNKNKFENTIDWAEEKVKSLSRIISLIQAQLEFTEGYDAQISKIKELINEQEKLVYAYSRQNSAYKNAYSNSLKSKYLTKSDINKIKNGSYDVQTFKGEAESGKKSYGENRYNAIKNALELKEKLEESRINIVNAKEQIREFAEQLADMPMERKQKEIDRLNSSLTRLENRLKLANGYENKNKLLNEQLNIQKEIVEKTKEAVNEEQNLANAYRNSLLKSKNISNNKKNVLIGSINKTNEDKKLLSNFNKQLQEVENKGKKSKNKYWGNVNQYDRPIIYWDESNINKYKTQLKSFGQDLKSLKGQISTTFGMSQEFESKYIKGSQIMFTPMLKDSKGNAVMLSQKSVNDYISKITKNAKNEKDILNADKKGTKVNIYNEKGKVIGEQYVKGIVNGITSVSNSDKNKITKTFKNKTFKNKKDLSKELTQEILKTFNVKADKNLVKELQNMIYGWAGDKSSTEQLSNKISEDMLYVLNSAQATIESYTQHIDQEKIYSELMKTYDVIAKRANELGIGVNDWFNLSSTNKTGTKKISLKGLSGNDLKNAIAYNAQIDQLREDTIKLNEESSALKVTIADIGKQKFDNISDYYDRLLNKTNSVKDAVKSKMDLAEAKGYGLSDKYYNKMKLQVQSQQIDLIEEKQKLENKLNGLMNTGQITYHSDQWYEMQSKIYDVQKNIDECTNSMVEFDNSIQQLKFDNFDKFVSKIDNITEESNFLISMLDGKNETNSKQLQTNLENYVDTIGNIMNNDGIIDTSLLEKKAKEIENINKSVSLTSTQTAKMGLHGQNYAVAMYKAEEFKARVESLNKEIAKDPYNQTLINKRDEYLKSQQECIKSAYDEKQAMIELKREGIQAQIDAFEKLNERQKEVLKTEQELHDRRKTIAEKTKAISDIQKQLVALGGLDENGNLFDSSDENKKKLNELKSEYKKAQEDLDETNRGYYYEDREKALDELLETYKTDMEDYSNNIELLFDEAIKHVNNNTSVVANSINAIAKETGYSISENTTNAWKNAGKSITEYGNSFRSANIGIINEINKISTAWNGALEAYDKYAKNSIGQINSNYSESGTDKDEFSLHDKIEMVLAKGNGTVANSQLNKYIVSKGFKPLTTSQMVTLAQTLGLYDIDKANKVTGTTDEANRNRKRILTMLKASYNTGGIAEYIHNSKEDGVVFLQKGEAIIDKQNTPYVKKLIENSKILANITDIAKVFKSNSINNVPISRMAQHNTIDARTYYNGCIAPENLLEQSSKIAENKIKQAFIESDREEYMKGVRRGI